MNEVNENNISPKEYLYWYASSKNIAPSVNIAKSMFVTGSEDMKQYLGIMYPFYEGLENYDDEKCRLLNIK